GVEHGREVVAVGRAQRDLVGAVAAQEVGGDRELDGGGGPAGVRGVAGAPGRAGDAVGEHDREVAVRADGAACVGGDLGEPLLLRAAPRPVPAARRGGGRGRGRDRVRGGGGRGRACGRGGRNERRVRRARPADGAPREREARDEGDACRRPPIGRAAQEAACAVGG